MVAQITEGTAFDKHGRPFRRRNPRPAIFVLVFLVAVSGVVWIVALTRPAKVREAEACNPPPQQAGSAPAQRLRSDHPARDGPGGGVTGRSRGSADRRLL